MKNALLLCLLFVAFGLRAQEEEALPRGLSDQERTLLQWAQFTTPPPAFSIESPPAYPVRHMAEWEELQALAITWGFHQAIMTQIVFHAALEVKVLVFCNSEMVRNNAELTLTNAGVNMANVELIIEPINSVWIRDYGPNCVYANDVDSLNFIDWVYNRPRPDDDLLPNGVAAHLGVPLYSTTLNPDRMVNTGGNFMSDGLGNAFASKLILEENAPNNNYSAGPHTEQDIDGIMQAYMGIDRYVKMETLPYDAIHHIDMHMRLLDEETLLVGEYPTGVADGPQIEANLQYVLDNFSSPFGTPYKVVRVLQPPANNGAYPSFGGDYRTYTNAVFVNKTILVPGYAMQYDTIAQRIYRKNFPGYKVKFINCNSIIHLSGALHCITKEIGAADPLWIVHQRHPNVENNDDVDGYDLLASIKHKSGIESATVFYTTDTTQAYQPLTMQPSGTADEWTCTIPHQANGSEVFYHISSSANSGKTQVRPLAAPAGYYNFRVNQLVSNAHDFQAAAMEAIFPNPAAGMTIVPVQVAAPCFAEIELRDVLGKSVQTIFTGQLAGGSSRHYFDAANLPAGIYAVSLKTAKGFASQKLVVR